jgi:hypothetical protein
VSGGGDAERDGAVVRGRCSDMSVGEQGRTVSPRDHGTSHTRAWLVMVMGGPSAGVSAWLTQAVRAEVRPNEQGGRGRCGGRAVADAKQGELTFDRH